MKMAVDLSSIAWNCLLTGRAGDAKRVEHDGKEKWVNPWGHGYEFAVNSIVTAMKAEGLVPSDLIFVPEGMNSKAPRLMIDSNYKSDRDTRPPEAYFEFQTLRDTLVSMFRNLGSLAIIQDNCEADDVMGWLAENTREDLVVMSNDNDMGVLNFTNQFGARIRARIDQQVGLNHYGDFPHKYITLYKALVGDQKDKITGIPGFGVAKWMDFHREFGEKGMETLTQMCIAQNADALEPEASQNKMVARIWEGRESMFRSWKLAKLHPEWVNRMGDPILFKPGFINGRVQDERLRYWSASKRLVTKDNYAEALAFLRQEIGKTKVCGVDLETSSTEEGDDWLSMRKGGDKKVDVMGAELTGASISFGNNGQFCYYISVDHAATANVSLDQLAEMLEVIPKDILRVAHNAAGFEFPVLYNYYGEKWKNNGYRGLLPNCVDSRIAASYWNENLMSHALKPLSAELLDYEQVTYAELTQGRKMRELTGLETLDYGCDDSYTAVGIWNFFRFFMELEGTFDTFMADEVKPAYLQALSYVRGVKLDMAKLNELKTKDEKALVTLSQTLDEYLIKAGWEGTVVPVYTELTGPNIKEACKICLGATLETAVRTVSKFPALIQALKVPGCETLAGLVAANDVESINAMVRAAFQAKPIFNSGSPLQMQKLLYETIGIQERLRNKPSPLMRKAGKPGTLRTDEDAIKLAIKQMDVQADMIPVLKAIMEIKSIDTRTGLYWTPYPLMIHWKTGKIHPSLRQSDTNTRRFTGSDPNVQQQDSTPGGVRSCIMPHKRNAVILSLDESAQEVRLLADYSLDPTLLSCYIGDKGQLRDVHSIVACRIADCSYEEFRRRLLEGTDAEKTEANAQRQIAKITLFATLYGAAAPKIAEGLGILESEAQEYIDAIYAQFPETKRWKDEVEAYAKKHGIVHIHGGTIRHLASLVMSDDKFVASKAMRQAGNSAIQAAGGTQIKRIMSDIWDSDLLDKYDYQFYFSVHDETVHSVATEHMVPVTEKLHQIMTKQFLNVVPSASSIGFGKSYGDLVEIGEVFSAEKVMQTLTAIFGGSYERPAVAEAA